MFSEKIVCYISAWHDFEMVKLLSPEREVLRIQWGKKKPKTKINQQWQKLEHEKKNVLIDPFFQRNRTHGLLLPNVRISAAPLHLDFH